MKNMSPKKRVTWIINSVMTLSVISIVAIVHYIKARYNLPTLVLYACSMPVLIGGFILFSKWLENNKWKDTVEEMEKEAEEEEAKSKPTPGIFSLVFIAIIAYNVKKKKIFTYTNARLIYGIGAIVIFSIVIQNHYWEITTMLPNDTVALNYSLLGVFIFFFGKVFDISVKMKEEQDLTI